MPATFEVIVISSFLMHDTSGFQLHLQTHENGSEFTLSALIMPVSGVFDKYKLDAVLFCPQPVYLLSNSLRKFKF